MLNLNKYYVRVRKAGESLYGSYIQWFVDATDHMDAKARVKRAFGPNYEITEVLGPFEHLSG